MKTTLMKTTWWCLASPGAAPRAVGADSRENEPRRQVWMYGTLVETASTPRERVHRWSTPLKDVPGGSAPRSTEVVGRPIAKRASLGTQIQRTIITARSQRQICARESPGILQASEVPFIQDGQAGRQRERVPCLGSRGRRGSGDGNEPRLVFFLSVRLLSPPSKAFDLARPSGGRAVTRWLQSGRSRVTRARRSSPVASVVPLRSAVPTR